jgi:hypothetical protein
VTFTAEYINAEIMSLNGSTKFCKVSATVATEESEVVNK